MIKATPARDVPVVEAFEPDMLRAPPHLLAVRRGPLPGDRSVTDRIEHDGLFLAIPNGKIVVTNREIFYLDADDRFFDAYYPKRWVYQARLDADGGLTIPTDRRPPQRREGAVFAPFLVAGNWFHTLADNLARMCYYRELGLPDLPVIVPAWATGAPNTDRASVNAAFLDGKPVHVLAPGVYHYDTVILPPLGNKDDYIYREPLRFVADTLLARMRKVAPPTHPLRLFVSRADIGVRNLGNEAELIAALRPLGITPVCPGDFPFWTQLELFAAAELIIGVHGQGLTPMICAKHCRLIMEFEAANWHFTAYRSFASCLDIAYEKLPCRLVEYRNPKRFDWLAIADIPACVERVARAVSAL
jgi:capsular polysaccharide biosynthesis protein